MPESLVFWSYSVTLPFGVLKMVWCAYVPFGLVMPGCAVVAEATPPADSTSTATEAKRIVLSIEELPLGFVQQEERLPRQVRYPPRVECSFFFLIKAREVKIFQMKPTVWEPYAITI